MPKDGKPDGGRDSGRSGSSGRSGGTRGGKVDLGKSGRPAAGGRGASSAGTRGGRTRPPANVVTAARPWGLIAGAIVVVLFAAAVLTYAVLKVRDAHKDDVDSASDISGVQTYDYAAGQEHTSDVVVYAESPPVGGPHEPPPNWADCSGSVYDVDIRHENVVHAMEHGAVWVTYNPDELSEEQIDTLADLVSGQSGRLMSPYAGLDSPVSIQSWNHQLKVDSVDDKRLKQFADLFTMNSDYYPEVGATCENADFLASPRLATEDTAAGVATYTPSGPATNTSETVPSESSPAATTAAETSTAPSPTGG